MIQGSPDAGATLTANPGVWGPGAVDLSYQWKRNGVALPLATDAQYVLAPTDAGASITVTVTGSQVGYTSVARTSAALVIRKLLTATPTPTVGGTPAVGSLLTATAGAWGPAPVVLAYQWRRDGVAIPGATARTYTVADLDLATSLSVAVTGTKAGYTTAIVESAAQLVE